MKKIAVLLVLVVLLCGCSAAETFETVDDALEQPVMGQVRKVSLTLPQSAASPVVNTDDGARLYLCDGYDLAVQTLVGGDINKTVMALCGYSADHVRVMESSKDGNKPYEWVRSAVGEEGDQIGRAMVLAQGDYHYCVSVMASAELAGSLEQEWTQIFSSLRVS